MILPRITQQDRSSDFWMSEISANTLSILTKFSWLFSLPKANAAIALLRTRLRNRRTCSHLQEDNLFSLLWQSSKAEVQISPKLIHYCSLPNIPNSSFTNYPKIRSYVVWNFKHGKADTMEHENLIVIHFISSTFGGFVRIVYSSSRSDGVMSGFVAYVEYIVVPYRRPLSPTWIYDNDLKFWFTCRKLDLFPQFVNKRHDRHGKLRTLNSADVKRKVRGVFCKYIYQETWNSSINYVCKKFF
jgi:hypothetical protein